MCPRCSGRKCWPTERGLLLCSECRRQVSVTGGTIFQDTRLPLATWFRVIWYVTSQKNGASALGLKRALGFGSYQTAWVWLHKLRRAMVRPGRDRLAGTIDVDETYVGGEKSGKRGRGASGKSLVVVAAQQDGSNIGWIRLVHVSNASGRVRWMSFSKRLPQAVQLTPTDGRGTTDLTNWVIAIRLFDHRVTLETTSSPTVISSPACSNAGFWVHTKAP